MHFYIMTLFPEMVLQGLNTSIIGRAIEKGLLAIDAVNIRDYAFDKHKSVDDTPCGGGAGMIMRPDVLGRAIAENHTSGRIIYMSPKGTPLTQKKARELAKETELTIICGRFEGIDERVIEAFNIEEISIGDYILTGGEQAAQIMLDAVVRLLPGVLGNEASLEDESFENCLLEYPQYTRPIEWEGRMVPEVLLSGHHQKIADWRKQQSEIATKAKRPDLFKKYLDFKNS